MEPIRTELSEGFYSLKKRNDQGFTTDITTYDSENYEIGNEHWMIMEKTDGIIENYVHNSYIRTDLNGNLCNHDDVLKKYKITNISYNPDGTVLSESIASRY